MNTLFADTLRKLRTDKGLSQIQLTDQVIVNKATISRWENGSRLPDAAMITRLSKVLEVDVGMLLTAAAESDESTNIIMVDDSRVILSDSLSVLEEVMPNATVTDHAFYQLAVLVPVDSGHHPVSSALRRARIASPHNKFVLS